MNTKKTVLRSKELTCPSCVAKIEKSLKHVDGVEDAIVHFNTGRIEVIHDPAQADNDKLVAAVREAGYAASVSPF
jgi:copper chaperone CopZ